MSSIDLHGKTWAEAIAEFVSSYNQAVAAAGASSPVLEVVHGYGSTGVGGALRTRLRGFLARHSSCLQFQPGEDVDGNPGHTLVTAIKRLPDGGGMLAEQVAAYCETPKTVRKITGRFRRHGDPQVQQAIRGLVKQGRLRQADRGRLKQYVAV